SALELTDAAVRSLTNPIMLRLPPAAALFPYTTLFRSGQQVAGRQVGESLQHDDLLVGQRVEIGRRVDQATIHQLLDDLVAQPLRSEEHTSELQSRENLVCRLLLEKKSHFNSYSSS